MSLKSSGLVKGIWYAIVLWLVGFVWGMIVFMVSLLKNVPSIPHVSKLSAVSLVLLPLYLVTLWYLAPRLLASAFMGVSASMRVLTSVFKVPTPPPPSLQPSVVWPQTLAAAARRAKLVVDMSVAYADFMVEAGSRPTGLERYLRSYA